MVSNALTGRKYTEGPPPVCKIPPERGPWPPPGAPATELHGYANWTDLDPVAPYAQQAMFPLKRMGAINYYFGRSSPGSVRLELYAIQAGTTPYWNIIIITYDPGAAPEWEMWPSVYVDPDKPFDTRLLTDVTIPGIDYRIARITL